MSNKLPSVRAGVIAFCMLFSCLVPGALAGQPILSAALEAPPYLDSPDHWDVHGPNGDLKYDLKATYWFTDEQDCDWYTFEITGKGPNGPFVSTGLAIDCTDGKTLDVWNGDSGNWVTWEWQGDHYEKVGGTANERTFHPA